MADRMLSHLSSVAFDKMSVFLNAAKQAGLDVLVINTYRSPEESDALYAQGRTTPGKIVTNAKGGDSFHNWRCAIDAVPLRGGKPLWEVFSSPGIMEPEWQQLAAIAAECGIEWAGNWKSFKEYDHFQYTNGLTIADFKNGKRLETV